MKMKIGQEHKKVYGCAHQTQHKQKKTLIQCYEFVESNENIEEKKSRISPWNEEVMRVSEREKKKKRLNCSIDGSFFWSRSVLVRRLIQFHIRGGIFFIHFTHEIIIFNLNFSFLKLRNWRHRRYMIRHTYACEPYHSAIQQQSVTTQPEHYYITIAAMVQTNENRI